MYRFLLSPKWVASFLLCVLAALVCVRLAHWQLDRLDQKRAINASIGFDRKLWRQDIQGSLAHAAMLRHVGIISAEDELVLKNIGVAAVYTPKDYALDAIMADMVRVVARAWPRDPEEDRREPHARRVSAG